MSKELEALESIKKTIISSTRGDRGFEYYYVSEIESTKKDFDIVEEALKRNEPMKPLLKDMGFEHYDIYCPSCKEYIGYRRNSVRQSFTRKYCSECGQRIEEEE